jgi:hypothetical protein
MSIQNILPFFIVTLVGLSYSAMVTINVTDPSLGGASSDSR